MDTRQSHIQIHTKSLEVNTACQAATLFGCVSEVFHLQVCTFRAETKTEFTARYTRTNSHKNAPLTWATFLHGLLIGC